MTWTPGIHKRKFKNRAALRRESTRGESYNRNDSV